ncbi:MAG: hypothetical protein U0K81_05720 [Paludibacteraceae bacterium]|nr:hypothetical protein [Paludibacteraceae bacterium]
MDLTLLLCLFYLISFTVLTVGFIKLQINNANLKQQLSDARIRELMYKKEYTMRQSYLLEQVIKSPEHSQGIDYLLRANEARIAYLKKHYANLTEVDIQVLILIGMGLETQDILLILDMSKRTYYKRRQIISKRMSISTTELDEKAQLLFNSKY